MAWLTVKEAINVYGVSRNSMNTMVKNNHVKHDFKDGVAVVDEVSLAKHLEHLTMTAKRSSRVSRL